MIEMPADLPLALKTFGDDLVILQLGEWKLDSYFFSRSYVGRTKYGGHIAAGNDAVNAVVIELVSGLNSDSSFAGWSHCYFQSDAVSFALKASRLVAPGVITLKLDWSGGLPLSPGSTPTGKDE